MTTYQVAAALAFFALGANFLGTTLLLLINPGSRSVRWYAAFTVVVVVWLALQGGGLLLQIEPWSLAAYRIAVHMLPTLFLAATVVQAAGGTTRWWLPWLVVAFGAALLLFFEPFQSPVTLIWQIFGWSASAVTYLARAFTGRGRRLGRRGSTRGEKVLELVLSGLIPVGVVGAILISGGFVLFVLPAITIAAQILLFMGVVFHRYYDIEVRAARTGELAAAAAEQDRLALLGELSATIAHEVRNPLTGIRSLTQMIAESPLDDAKRRRYTDVILGEIARLDRIVGNLSDLARRSARTSNTDAGPTALDALFEDLVMLVEPRARRADVTVSAAPTRVVVHAPREALAQALLNLLLNAVAHAPAQSVVDLCAVRQDGTVTVSVRDRGPGVPQDQQQRIFEPFHTTGGTGLGLAVVRHLASEHGWKVDVVDAEGGGAEFRIKLKDQDTA